MNKPFLLFICLLSNFTIFAQKKRARDYGIEIGVLRTGKLNAITDVTGVKVGQVTFHQPDGVHTGVTAILPHDKNIFQNKIPAAIHIGNGFGKLAGYSQVEELGNIETPIVLTNTLSVPTASAAIIDFTFQSPENKDVRSVNPIVGETNDGGLNDIRRRFITKEHVLEALKKAQTGPLEEGNVGAGAGTVCFGFKGGIGTSSRILPKSKGGYTVGVLVQSNFGGVLQVNGVPVGIEMKKHKFSKIDEAYKDDGSCMIVILTDAPLSAKNLKRLAARAMLGLGRTGGMAANGSGDYVIAASTAEDLRIAHNSDSMHETFKVLRNNDLDLLFEAVIEATEEAIINSLFAAETLTGFENTKVEALPIDKTVEILKKYNRVK
ncbi:MAG: P1 family peptidase [Emticicia sp.]|uniref:DmpA family aminopeptidase n=1 Tax=Emticicia sp. TaxID=1930953 RepID=UPI003BA46C8E